MALYALRASVRQMVEFALRSGDLTPASIAAMQAGARGHKARQALSGAENERAVRWQGEYCGIDIEIIGRADIVHMQRDFPLIEELKLLPPASSLPKEPVPVHRMQAVCYAFMLANELRLACVGVRISYISESGSVRAAFEETLTCEDAQAAFFTMLTPLANWQQLQLSHIARRNEALRALAFPYPAYRAGQREMAVQVYAAISRKKRLFAMLPTGTGKSAATLFPALKALGESKTRQIFYLTARGTTQLAALDALERMMQHGLKARYLTLTAREKCCPQSTLRCHPDYCPRARGYFDRERPALMEMAAEDVWTKAKFVEICERYALCPFEFSLSLSEISDVILCDYNYAFDPAVMLERIFGAGKRATLLIDEAHNLPSRVRSMLSCTLDSREFASLRRETGRLHSRRHPLYAAMTTFLQILRTTADADALLPAVEALLSAMAPGLDAPQAEGYTELFRTLVQARLCLRRMAEAKEDYHTLCMPHGREQEIRLLCLNVTSHIARITKRTDGCVCFSATLMPLMQMRTLLGGDSEDALFALPSPFPGKRLLVLQRDISTRYQQRADTAADVARSILAMFDVRSGKYIAYFPSYAYLELIREALLALRSDLPLNVQERSMTDEARTAFLQRFDKSGDALLSLCVLGGIFSEGIDLPGQRLIGVAVVGVGLPQVNEEQEALRASFDHAFGDGFGFAYRYPGMHKVLQAAGRVIRTETDAGIVLLLDDRYRQSAYAQLLPPHYEVHPVLSAAEILARGQEFWRLYGN